jgi:SOS response regulatory protein OraA/RecX
VAPRVTALRARRDGRVLVQIDGNDWRVLAADIVVRARLTPGTELDRPRLREVARERRRTEALAAAGRVLRHRDLPTRALDARLARRGIGAQDRAGALSALQGAGLVDDVRFAQNRALALAGRCLGDAAIRFDLETYGVPPELVEEALSGLEPEARRAERIVASRGRSPTTARFLARKGFGDDAVEAAAGEVLG